MVFSHHKTMEKYDSREYTPYESEIFQDTHVYM